MTPFSMTFIRLYYFMYLSHNCKWYLFLFKWLLFAVPCKDRLIVHSLFRSVFFFLKKNKQHHLIFLNAYCIFFCSLHFNSSPTILPKYVWKKNIGSMGNLWKFCCNIVYKRTTLYNKITIYLLVSWYRRNYTCCRLFGYLKKFFFI